MQVTVEAAAQIVHHPLTDADRRVVVQHGQSREQRVDEHQGGARRDKDRGRRPSGCEPPRQRVPAQHRIDDHLERPRFQQLAHAEEQHLDERPQERPSVRAQVGQDPAGDAAHFTGAGKS